ncbi:MAG: hypothetical protein GX621_03510 [Pirellulaceae bacterium]|nr:hypothetical protein [Pirellulaceae bacterium]
MSDASLEVPSGDGRDAAPAVYRESIAPLPLRIVAFLFILLGVLSATEIVLSLIKGRFNLDIGVLGIFIGRGLLRRSERWRSCGAWFVGFAFVMLGLGVLAYGVVRLLFSPSASVNVSVEPSPGVVVLVAIVAYWAFRVLRGPAAREWCSEPYVPDPARGRFQFTLRTMLLAMVVCSFVFARISTDNELIYERHANSGGSSRSTPDGQTGIYYVSSPHRFLNKRPRLDYVVFDRSSKGQTGGRVLSHSPVTRSITINGATIDLSGKCQLHEIVDGAHTTSDRRVTMEELDAYLASQPDRYMLQDFLDFVDARRQKPKDGGS